MLPDAAGRGPMQPAQPATVYTDAYVWDLIVQGGKIRRLEAHFLDGTRKKTGKKVHVEPKLGVLFAAGAVGSPAILLRAQSFAEVRPEKLLHLSRQLGKHTHMHPVTICFGKYLHETHAAYGVPDNMMTDDFAAGETGYLIETGSSFPVMTALLSLDFGDDLVGFMKDYYAHQTVLYAHHTTGFDRDHPYGSVEIEGRAFRPVLHYKLDPRNTEPMRDSLKQMTRIHVAAGAQEVYHVTNPAIRIRSEAELGRLDQVEFGVGKTSMLTVHVMGGCAMGSDPQRSVVNTDFRLRGLDNAWVVDGSVFPTGLGANPQVTIYALALWASEQICYDHQRGAAFKLHHQASTGGGIRPARRAMPV